MAPRILIAEDEDRLRRLLSMLLEDKGYDLSLAKDGCEAWNMFKANAYDLVITDLRMPEMDGMQLLHQVKDANPELPVIVITAFGSIDNAVEAMRDGAIDYITKPFEEQKLKLAIERALKLGQIMGENKILRKEIRAKYNIETMIAESDAMKRVIDTAMKVARSNATVLVYGESGTGKELITRAIHENSHREHGPFVAINCAAIPENLLESELFGHEKGAFTGAMDRKAGKFELANGGTLFLDEIGEMELQIQPKVLRAIEQQEFERVGGTRTVKSDIRFIAATNRDLQVAVRENKFREDLYFRVNVFPITIPPLRQRREDVLPLAHFFLKKFAQEMGKRVPGLSGEAEHMLLNHSWPGNVRELQNRIERAIILWHDGDITPAELSISAGPTAEAQGESETFTIPVSGFSLENHEKQLLLQALDRTRCNKSQAAKLLGLSRATLRYRLEKFGIQDPVEAVD